MNLNIIMTDTFRDYKNAKQNISDTYKLKHTNQTFVYSCNNNNKFFGRNSNKINTDIWSMLLLSNDIIDESDPDINIGQINHAFQVAEKLRVLYPDDEQLHLTGLLHDLGKILLLPKFCQQEQWEVVGDIYPVGCAFSDKIVFSEYFSENLDTQNELFNTKYGIYEKNVGFDKVMMCWSHDEYLYKILNNNSKLDKKYLRIIRYHSFYAFHKENEYEYLANDEDMKLKPLLKLFSECDLYTKSDEFVDISKLEPYYKNLIDKYCNGNYEWPISC